MTPILPPLTEDEIEAIYAQLRESQGKVARVRQGRMRFQWICFSLVLVLSLFLVKSQSGKLVMVSMQGIMLLVNLYQFSAEKQHTPTLKKVVRENPKSGRCALFGFIARITRASNGFR